jgi:predicted glutamine amidotransferase
MCELMALCLDRPAAANFSIREFGSRDAQNMDGWGLAWYPDQSAALIKEPVSWRASEHTGFLEKYHALKSTIFIAHVRHKTVGGRPTHADTHPFLQELCGRHFIFAHNGTLTGLDQQYPLRRFQSLGATDSEYAFCVLMTQLARHGRHLSTMSDFRWMHRRLTRLNESGELNCLMSDGHSLFAYHDAAAYKGLSWSKVNIERHHAKHFEDSEMHLAVESAQPISGVSIATHPLATTGWQSFEPGELMVLQSGRLLYSSHRTELAEEPRRKLPV